MLSYWVTTLLLGFTFCQYKVAAITCYNYHLNVDQDPTDPSLGGGASVVRNCQPERQLVQQPQLGFLQSGPGYGACVKASFYESSGEEVIVGYCAGADRCPPQFAGKDCLYPDGGTITQMIIQMTGIPNPTAVCCCQTDYCNEASQLKVASTLLVLVVIMVIYSSLFG
uniref:Uncharacterized protein n=1 Tax=Plectus sambesii TaxID=2011161 RepID=A0A914WS90_9BILA